MCKTAFSSSLSELPLESSNIGRSNLPLRGPFDRVGFESSIVGPLYPFISLRVAFDHTDLKVTFESVL